MPDPVKGEGESQENGGQSTDKPGEQGKKEGETPTISQEQYNKLIDGWREDREEADREIAELKAEKRSNKLSKTEEDELEGLDENERVDKLVEIRERKQKEIEMSQTIIV